MIMIKNKDKDLEIEIARVWGMKTQIVPVVIGALGVIKKGIDKQISKSLEISTHRTTKDRSVRIRLYPSECIIY